MRTRTDRGRFGLLPLTAAVALLAGCASFSPDGGFGTVEQTAREKLDKDVRWARSEEDRAAVADRVAELLAQSLSADDAVQIALLNNRGLQAGFRQTPALVDIDLAIGAREILAVTGLAGAGKSTLLRCFNRMNDGIAGFRVGGEILFRGRNLYGRDIDLTVLRTRIGMVSSRPNPFPRSIQENIAYAACLHGRACGILEQEQIVETALRQVDLWNLLRNKLGAPALSLSRGQQQRLCLARALALQPEVLLLDEPTAGMDSLEAGRFENLIGELAEHRTLILATQSVNLAARVSQRMGFLHQGRLIEIGPTRELFTQPRRTLTEAYLTGRLLDL